MKAKFDAVIVKPLKKKEQQHGNIIVPDIDKQSNEKAEVVAVGPGARTVLTGELIPTETKVGEIVILPTMGFTKFNHDGETYYVGKEKELLAEI